MDTLVSEGHKAIAKVLREIADDILKGKIEAEKVLLEYGHERDYSNPAIVEMKPNNYRRLTVGYTLQDD